MRDYERLDVWRKAHDLALEMYRAPLDQALPSSAAVAEALRAAAREIAVIIVRGCVSASGDGFASAMREAQLRTEVLGYRLRFARDAELLPSSPYARLEARADRLAAMLGGLTRTVRFRLKAGARAVAERAIAPDGDSWRPRSRPRSTS